MSADYMDDCPSCGAVEELRVYDGRPVWITVNNDGVKDKYLTLDYSCECRSCGFKKNLRNVTIDYILADRGQNEVK